MFLLQAQPGIPPIGLWRDHLPYNSAIDIAVSADRIYCATPYSLFSVARRGSDIERFSRINGLSETGISAIHFDENLNKLVIAYTNSNIDIIYRNDIFNVPDIKRDNIVGDKTIHGIYSLQNNFYLSTGLGVIVIDAQRYEVKDTWLIGNAGGQVAVNGLTTDALFFYAATAEGLKRAPLNASNLADYKQWQLVSGTNDLPTGNYQGVWNLRGNILAQRNDSLFVQTATAWQLFYTDDWTLAGVSVSESKVIICQQNTNGSSRILVLNENGSIANTLVHPGLITQLREAVLVDDNTWVADMHAGLSVVNDQGGFESIVPTGPAGTANAKMMVREGVLYVAAGGVDENWHPQHNTNGFYRFENGMWESVNAAGYPSLNAVKDIISIAVDPIDASVWAGSFGNGLVHFKNSSADVLRHDLLLAAVADPLFYGAAGLAFDRDQNLWVTNYGAAEPLLLKKPDGGRTRFSIPFFLAGNALTDIIVDDYNYKWIIAAKGGGLLVFDHGSSTEQISDDRWKLVTTGSGNGNLPGAEVLCIAGDKNGFIWIGTNNGVAVIQCPQQIFEVSSCDAIWPVVAQGNFAGYLFKGEEVQSIAVDGADRKWVGTKKGAWLISASGEEVISRFTEENSPLLSNDVNEIAIDGKTGEVFFSTAKGICSFRGTATTAGVTKENVLIFPNPVPPGYAGSIGIRGLPDDAIIKITALDGRLVWQGRALGGQGVWSGNDYRGRRISTGVYLVLAGSDGKTEKNVGKIVFINR